MRPKAGADPRPAWALLAAMMAASAALILWFSRGATFSPDELAWVALSPDLNLDSALQPHSGHLVLTAHLVYKAMLEAFGMHALPFRLLTIATLFGAVGLMYAYMRRILGDYLALAPCAVLLFFGSDGLHLMQGNGFTVILSVACGFGGLLALRRGEPRFDLLGCALLSLGVLTYTVALAFLIGAAVTLLAGPGRLRRSWTVLVPLGIYLAWRVWLLAGDVALPRGELAVSNALLLPSWAFEALSSILSAITGLGFDFSGREELSAVGAPLALAFIVAIAWRLARGRLPRDAAVWALAIVMLAMFLSQALVYIPGVRGPDAARYLFPGAFLAMALAAEAVRGRAVPRPAFAAVALIAAAGVATNLYLLRDYGAELRARGDVVRADVTAARLLTTVDPLVFANAATATPLEQVIADPFSSWVGEAERKYGPIARGPIADGSAAFKARLDRLLASVYGIALGPDLPSLAEAGCRSFRADSSNTVVAPLPTGRLRLSLPSGGGEVALSRFGPGPGPSAGTLAPGAPMAMVVPGDSDPARWHAWVSAPSLRVCEVS